MISFVPVVFMLWAALLAVVGAFCLRVWHKKGEPLALMGFLGCVLLLGFAAAVLP